MTATAAIISANPCPTCGAFLWSDPRPCWNCRRREVYGPPRLTRLDERAASSNEMSLRGGYAEPDRHFQADYEVFRRLQLPGEDA